MEIPLEKVEVRVRNEEIDIENIKTLVKKLILRKDGGKCSSFSYCEVAETEFILT